MKTIIQNQQQAQIRPKLRLSKGGLSVLEGIGLIIAIYTFVNLTTVRFVVDGLSMFPSFETGEYLIVERLSYLFSEPQRGDVIVFHLPSNPNRDFIKRVIALPGETIEFRSTEVYINGQRLDEPYIHEPCDSNYCADGIWQIGNDEYFVMGDNRNQSSDSRFFGAINTELIVGEAWLRYYPFSDIEYLHQIGLTNE